uniref:Signal recognition particle 54 kDa protein n=1 Tax=Lotharella globosa TaxID=91324 RepID=A0A7S3Z5Y5_9EUKA|mmetsp:Transcript_20940/g.40525  ORF Transcript_20940/g.40525 Transcript_20940/m.40525 type:complete len:528 (+) Transcript_20940:111-1694(+)|eukprot:CAMPEP_0167794228 /NCGR_PEP_ID=MMETSP0111_2-20121227/13682_1 /TAXON_ID=91324 /ORGANISM="Lotharella globosa, Strain CCCM811" /LENGTH=527 /DNA_ID=CAMNT_0007687599 /DNA_START=36 /DNA_END=1619 /DNA_ORIENTATION=-
MVLASLGNKITKALQDMAGAEVLDDKVVDKMLNTIATALLMSDVDVKIVKKMQNDVRQSCSIDSMASGVNKRKVVQQAVIKGLTDMLDSKKMPFKPKRGKSNVYMFVGLQGSGKTTSCMKLAYYYKRKGWKVLLVCADTFRAGAYDQLKQNATKAKVAYYGSYTERDPCVVAEKGVELARNEKYEIIIVDTSGRHKQESALFEEMQMVHQAVDPDEVIFVMDSSIGQAAKLQAKAFQDSVDVGSIIVTKMDNKNTRGGGALSAVAATGSPVTFIGTGEKMDAFERFDAESFVGQLLGMGNIKGLMDIFQDQGVMESQEKLVKKITSKGEFTFRDMRDQFQTIMGMGSLGKIMGMIPGLKNLMGDGREEQSQARMKRFMTILDSMTNKELDGDNSVFNKEPSRIIRVARGAGVTERAVVEVMETFKPFKKIAAKLKTLGKNGLDLSKMRGNQANMTINNLASAMSPQMLQNMGGLGNFQKMMQQMGGMGGLSNMMGGAGGMPDMKKMQQMMAQMGMAGKKKKIRRVRR